MLFFSKVERDTSQEYHSADRDECYDARQADQCHNDSNLDLGMMIEDRYKPTASRRGNLNKL